MNNKYINIPLVVIMFTLCLSCKKGGEKIVPGDYHLNGSGTYTFEGQTFSASISDITFVVESSSKKEIQAQYVSPIENDPTVYPPSLLLVDKKSVEGEFFYQLAPDSEIALTDGEILKVNGDYKIIGNIQYRSVHHYIEGGWPLEALVTVDGTGEFTK